MRPPTEGAEPPRENLSTETIMAGVRLRVRQQIGWEQPGAGTANAYDEVKRVFQASQETLRPLSPFYPQVLGSEDMWEVPTPLVFETHRGVLGRVLIWGATFTLIVLGLLLVLFGVCVALILSLA